MRSSNHYEYGNEMISNIYVSRQYTTAMKPYTGLTRPVLDRKNQAIN
jgi:hypothetical protein